MTKGKNAWALWYSSCVSCHTTDIKHHAGGLCHRCYNDKYNDLKKAPARDRNRARYAIQPKLTTVDANSIRKEAFAVIANVLSKDYGLALVYENMTVSLVNYGRAVFSYTFKPEENT